jgi:hypothetical protein
MGSIPPALSIENPQREIHNFITDSGIAPNDGDVHQLSKSVQNGKVNFCQDGGTPNFVAITPTPALTSYQIGQYFRIRVAANNTGPTQVNVSNLGWASIVHADQTAMGAGELLAGQMIEIAYDGNGHWQMITGGLSGSLINLTAPREFFVNVNTGNDTLYDGTQEYVDATQTHGPFQSITHALAQSAKYNLAGFGFFISVAPGTYVQLGRIDAPIPNGSGTIVVRGRSNGQPVAANSVKITNVQSGSTWHINGGFYSFDNVSFESVAGGPGDNGDCLWVSGSGGCWLYNVAFWGSASHHMLAAQGGSISMSGPISIYGSALSHMSASQNGNIAMFPAPLPTLNIINAVSFTWFAAADTGGQMQATYAAINGYNNVTGTKYFCTANGIINTFGRGTEYLPGNAGSGNPATQLQTGGQYV